MNTKPVSTYRRVGECAKCGNTLRYSDAHPSPAQGSNVGDYDFICYNCQFELMDAGKWEEYRDRHLQH